MKENIANSIQANLAFITGSSAEITRPKFDNSFDSRNDTMIRCRGISELHALQNLIIIEDNQESLFKITNFIENRYANIFHVATFSTIVQALLKVNQNTSIFIFDCTYFDKESPKIIRFVKNRNYKTLVISQFDTKKMAATIDGFIKKRFHHIKEKTTIHMEINTIGLKQEVFPFHFSKAQLSRLKNYQYMFVLLLIVLSLFLMNL